jgi:hypothetical protein
MTPEAEAAFIAGKTLYERGDYLGALTRLREAHNRSSQAEPLRWLFRTQKKLSRYTEMIGSLRAYIQHPDPTIPLESRRIACESFSKAVSSTGTIRVVASEAGATVVLGEDTTGTTPLPDVLRVDGERPVVVQITKPGRKPYTWKGIVPAGQEITLDAVLAKDTHEGHLTVDAEPGDLVSLDGEPVAAGPWNRAVASGPHTLLVTGPLMLPYSIDLTIQDNTVRDVVARLQPAIPTWVWVLGGTLLAGGAAVGASFLFQPSYRGGNVGSPGYVELSSGGLR